MEKPSVPKAPLVGEPGRNINFSIEAHTRPKRGTIFWLQVYERVGTSPQGDTPDFKWPEMIEWGQKSTPQKIPRASNKPKPKEVSGPKFNPQKIPCRISEP